ncbi:MAG: hypothetical protein SPI25_02850 [Dialister sp.]|nr:hypothetical protein [Dialister sp.]
MAKKRLRKDFGERASQLVRNKDSPSSEGGVESKRVYSADFRDRLIHEGTRFQDKAGEKESKLVFDSGERKSEGGRKPRHPSSGQTKDVPGKVDSATRSAGQNLTTQNTMASDAPPIEEAVPGKSSTFRDFPQPEAKESPFLSRESRERRAHSPTRTVKPAQRRQAETI